MKPIYLLTALILLMSFACAKDVDIPLPMEAPEVPKIEEPAEEVKPEPPPRVEPVEEPDPLANFKLEEHPMDDIYFEFDKADLTDDARAALQRYAEVIKLYEGLNVLIEGHCDERGTEEYNLALGERRATRIHEYLVQLGVKSQYLKTISYGESQPKVRESDEAAWDMNRRAHFLVSK